MNQDELRNSFQQMVDFNNQKALNPDSHEYRIQKLEEKIAELERKELLTYVEIKQCYKKGANHGKPRHTNHYTTRN